MGTNSLSKQVSSFTWDKLEKGINISDYEVVILNFMPFQEDSELKTKTETSLFPNREDCIRFIFSPNSELIVIGIPFEKINQHGVTFNSWFPLTPKFELNKGSSIEIVNKEFDFYFTHVDNWFFHVDSQTNFKTDISSPFSTIVHPDSKHLFADVIPIAKTRFERPVSFNLIQRVINANGHTLISSSGFFWLPPTTNLSSQETTDLILRYRYNVLPNEVLPLWVQAYKLPKQLPIEDEIKKHQEAIEDHKTNLLQATNELEVETRFRKLLYTQHEDAGGQVRLSPTHKRGGLA